ncbi:MAG: hypothetical protein P4L03_10325 [Terracidiphilus sp.]|nr:hypothetical protein [Terracidiphilus sp.]
MQQKEAVSGLFLAVFFIEQGEHFPVEGGEIGLNNFPDDIVLQGCVTVDDLIAKGDDIADHRDPVTEFREIAQQLRKGLAYDSKFAFNGRAQQLVSKVVCRR